MGRTKIEGKPYSKRHSVVKPNAAASSSSAGPVWSCANSLKWIQYYLALFPKVLALFQPGSLRVRVCNRVTCFQDVSFAVVPCRRGRTGAAIPHSSSISSSCFFRSCWRSWHGAFHG